MAGGWQDLTVTAHVISEGNLESEEPGSWRQRIDVETEQIDSASRTQRVSIGLRLNIYSKSSNRCDLEESGSSSEASKSASETPDMRLFRYGERLRFVTKLNAPRNFGNPGAFDYVGYLRDQGTVATTSAKAPGIVLLRGLRGNRFERALARAHRSIVGRIHGLWQEQDAVLIDAMLIGEKSFIERHVRMNFQRSGTYPMLIVAGLHLGILAGFVLLDGCAQKSRTTEVPAQRIRTFLRLCIPVMPLFQWVDVTCTIIRGVRSCSVFKTIM